MSKLLPPKLFFCQNRTFATDNNNLMEDKSLFERAVGDSHSANIKPSNETALQLYSLYKQATEGDINIEPPQNPYDFVEKAKYEAWSSLKGKTIKEAQNEYINLVNKLKN